MFRLARRMLSISRSVKARQVIQTEKGNQIVVEVVEAPVEKPTSTSTSTSTRLFSDEHACSLCTCHVPVKISYRDVLILEQFMRSDGTVLPQSLTGLCGSQQLRIERCIMQAHWSGLFPDRTDASLDRSGYRRHNRYWDDDMDMYRLKHKVETGTWYYTKRYPVRVK